MAKNSSIEWTDHTFNPWWGCAKVSPGCDRCYAETWAKRLGLKVWGKNQERRFFTDKHWNEPMKWNADAVAEGRRQRVFCASMADVFEDRTELNQWRDRLWTVIGKTKKLDWLLLTKRPQNVMSMAPWSNDWPANVWLGTTVEDQVRANTRLPILLSIPAATRFLSCEPLIGAVDLSMWTGPQKAKESFTIDWVIAGGESGPGARPMFPSWARTLRDQCLDAKIPFHFKQWGHWAPATSASTSGVKQFWDDVTGQEVLMEARGKKDAGRDLDGKTWDELPKAA